MTIQTDNYIERLIQWELTDVTRGTNHNIYDKRLTATNPSASYTYVPCTVYFYYLAFDSANRVRVDHFEYRGGPIDAPGEGRPIPVAKLRAVIEMLAANARKPDTDSTKAPGVSGQNFEGIIWQRKSYIVIVLDENDWYFQTRNNNQVAAAFNTSKGGMPNHSFFDGMDLTINIDNGDGTYDARSAIAFVNHMKASSDGDDLGAVRQDFTFDAYVKVNYVGTSSGPLHVILDPGGTNQGPPTYP